MIGFKFYAHGDIGWWKRDLDPWPGLLAANLTKNHFNLRWEYRPSNATAHSPDLYPYFACGDNLQSSIYAMWTTRQLIRNHWRPVSEAVVWYHHRELWEFCAEQASEHYPQGRIPAPCDRTLVHGAAPTRRHPGGYFRLTDASRQLLVDAVWEWALQQAAEAQRCAANILADAQTYDSYCGLMQDTAALDFISPLWRLAEGCYNYLYHRAFVTKDPASITLWNSLVGIDIDEELARIRASQEPPQTEKQARCVRLPEQVHVGTTTRRTGARSQRRRANA